MHIGRKLPVSKDNGRIVILGYEDEIKCPFFLVFWGVEQTIYLREDFSKKNNEHGR